MSVVVLEPRPALDELIGVPTFGHGPAYRLPGNDVGKWDSGVPHGPVPLSVWQDGLPAHANRSGGAWACRLRVPAA